MSDFTGPGLYCICSFTNPKYSVDLYLAGKADGTKVTVYEHDLNHPHARWQFAHAGIGKSGKDEYIISNITSGTYLTAPAGTKKEGLLTGSCLPPDDDRIRWSVIPLRNGTGAYWIAPVANKTLSLNVKSNKNENGNPVWLWPGSAANTDPASMWYIRLADGGSLSCPEVGKAPINSHSRM